MGSIERAPRRAGAGARHRLRRLIDLPQFVEGLALSLPAEAWEMISWREDNADVLISRFARVGEQPPPGSLSPMPARAFDLPQCWPNGCMQFSFWVFSEGAMVRILAITKEKLTPGAKIEHLWLALVIIALIGAVGLGLMMAVGH